MICYTYSAKNIRKKIKKKYQKMCCTLLTFSIIIIAEVIIEMPHSDRGIEW